MDNNNEPKFSETIEEFKKEMAFTKTLKALYGTNADNEGKGEVSDNVSDK